MKVLLNWLLVASLFAASPKAAFADVSGLTPCKDSAVFKKRLDGSVKKLQARLANYTEGTPAYLALEQQIDQTKARFAKYGDNQMGVRVQQNVSLIRTLGRIMTKDVYFQVGRWYLVGNEIELGRPSG